MRTVERPNVLILYTDQQRWDSLRCYGNGLAITPNLDRLAAEGARFDHYFVQNPYCMPSRMSFLTGRYCSSLQIGDNGIPFPQTEKAVHNLLKPYGYHTAQIGKLHFQPHARRDHRDPHPDYGFDTFILSDEPGCYDDAYTRWVGSIDPAMVAKVRTGLPPAALEYGMKAYTDQPRNTHEPYVFEGDEDLTHSAFVASEMCRFLETQDTRRPFFAIAGFYAPHCPLNPPKRFLDMYDISKMPLPRLGENESFIPMLKDVPEEKWRETMASYLALVTHVDDCVGTILDTLERKGLSGNTLVIFTSDHGEFLGDHGRIQKGMPGHDCITRVPLILRYPGKINGGMVVESLTEGVDMVPTLLDYCSVQIPRVVQGKTLRPLLEGRSHEHRESVFAELFEPHGLRHSTVRTKEYKYYCNSVGEEILFDLRQDPYELRNVVQDISRAGVLSEMRKLMVLRMHEAAYNAIDKPAAY